MIERPASTGKFAPRRARALPLDVPPPSDEGDTGGDSGSGSLVMYDGSAPAPPFAQRWGGWPVEWATPNWGSMVGLSEITRRVSTVFAAMDLNARILSTMPPYRTRGGKLAQPLAWMRNPQPEVYNGWSEAFKQIVLSYQSGEAILWATDRFRDSGKVMSWMVLDPAWVRIELDGAVRSYTSMSTGDDITADVLHIRYASWPGEAHGIGPLAAAAKSLVGAAALEAYQADLASRGGIPWGVITAEGRLTAEQARDMRMQYVTARAGARGAPAVFSGGATLETLNISPKDMALLELRQFDEARLAVLLGAPPFLLGLPSGGDAMTYKNAEGIYDFHWRSSLRPMASTLMEAIGNWALMDRVEAVELNRDEYVRPSLQDRAAAYSTLHDIVEVDPETGRERRAITVDEIRAAERFEATTSVGSGASSVAVPT